MSLPFALAAAVFGLTVWTVAAFGAEHIKFSDVRLPAAQPQAVLPAN